MQSFWAYDDSDRYFIIIYIQTPRYIIPITYYLWMQFEMVRAMRWYSLPMLCKMEEGVGLGAPWQKFMLCETLGNTHTIYSWVLRSNPACIHFNIPDVTILYHGQRSKDIYVTSIVRKLLTVTSLLYVASCNEFLLHYQWVDASKINDLTFVTVKSLLLLIF